MKWRPYMCDRRESFYHLNFGGSTHLRKVYLTLIAIIGRCFLKLGAIRTIGCRVPLCEWACTIY